jgi:hypothetical protein
MLLCASEARPANIRFTCNPSLARNLLQGFKLADCVTGRVVMVEAIVSLFTTTMYIYLAYLEIREE